MSAPVSSIAFCANVGLNSKYEHTYYFNTLGEQRTFFNAKAVKGVVPLTYLRKRMDIRVAIPFSTARKYDYCYFRNDEDKIWYYFIEDIEYVNDNTTLIKLELDVMQTYMFDYDLLPCYVEREHSKTDEFGENLTDEGLDVGDYRTVQTLDVSLKEYVILMASTFVAFEPTGNIEDYNTSYNGVWSGLVISAVPSNKWPLMQFALEAFNAQSDGIVAMWLYPKNLVRLNPSYTWEGRVDDENPQTRVFYQVDGVDPIFQSITPLQHLNGYTPHNKKLLQYPFNMLYATNNNGAAAAYKIEQFGDRQNTGFKIVGTTTPDAAVKMYPLNYSGEQHAYEHGLTLDNFPQCAWTQDVYKLWLAQNQSQQAVATGTGVLQLAAGVVMAAATVASGGAAGAVFGTGAVTNISGGLSTLLNLNAQKQDREIQPRQAKGVHNSNVNINAGSQTFTIKQKTITSTQAKRLDAFFDLYGYKTLLIKVPNRNVRKYWTYTKTNGCKIKSKISNEGFSTGDVRAIEDIYNKGITFWKSSRAIGDYSNPEDNKPV